MSQGILFLFKNILLFKFQMSWIFQNFWAINLTCFWMNVPCTKSQNVLNYKIECEKNPLGKLIQNLFDFSWIDLFLTVHHLLSCWTQACHWSAGALVFYVSLMWIFCDPLTWSCLCHVSQIRWLVKLVKKSGDQFDRNMPSLFSLMLLDEHFFICFSIPVSLLWWFLFRNNFLTHDVLLPYQPWAYWLMWSINTERSESYQLTSWANLGTLTDTQH